MIINLDNLRIVTLQRVFIPLILLMFCDENLVLWPIQIVKTTLSKQILHTVGYNPLEGDT